MAVNTQKFQEISSLVTRKNATLVAVSKTKPAADIQALYDLGQRDFGENYVQELVEKQAILPADIRWHFIGHLQTNKVKYIAPFVHLIHGVDSEKLLKEINKQAKKIERKIACLLQMHIAREESKFGLDEAELELILPKISAGDFPFVHVEGLMGMASFSDNEAVVQKEFQQLHEFFLQTKKAIPVAQTLSMGMSGDYELALAQGSTMVRIGSLLFGARNA